MRITLNALKADITRLEPLAVQYEELRYAPDTLDLATDVFNEGMSTSNAQFPTRFEEVIGRARLLIGNYVKDDGILHRANDLDDELLNQLDPSDLTKLLYVYSAVNSAALVHLRSSGNFVFSKGALGPIQHINDTIVRLLKILKKKSYVPIRFG